RSWFQRATVLSVANAVHQVQRFKDAIAQRSSPGLASNRANRQAQTDASVTIRPLILTPAQWVSQICTETDVLAADVPLYPRHARPLLHHQPPVCSFNTCAVCLSPHSSQVRQATFSAR